MKKFWVIITVNIFLVVLQSSFFPELFGVSKYINILLAFCFALFLSERTNSALASGLVGGVLLDILGLHSLGFYSFFIILFLLFSSYIRRYFIKSNLVQIVLLLLYYYLLRAWELRQQLVFNMDAFVGAIYTVIFTGICYFVINKITRVTRS